MSNHRCQILSLIVVFASILALLSACSDTNSPTESVTSSSSKTTTSPSAPNSLTITDNTAFPLNFCCVKQVLWSPDGKFLAVGYNNSYGPDLMIKIYTADGSPVVALPVRWNYLDWSPDSKELVVTSGNSIMFFDTSGKLLNEWDDKTYNDNGDNNSNSNDHTAENYYTALAWSPDGKNLVAAIGIYIQFFSSSGKLVSTISNATKNNQLIHSLAWSPDSKTLLSASSDSSIQFWDSNGKPITTNTVVKDDIGADSLAWSPDGKFFASISEHNLRIWSADGRPVAVAASQNNRTTSSLAWSPDSKLVVGQYWNGAVTLDLNGNTQKLFANTNGQYHSNVAFSSSANLLAVGTPDGKIELWSPNNSNSEISTSEDAVESLAWSPDGKTLVSATSKVVQLWNSKGQLLTSFTGSHYSTNQGDTVKDVVWSPDGKMVFGVFDDLSIQVWNSDGKYLATIYNTNTDSGIEVKNVDAQWSPDSKFIAAAYDNQVTQLLNTASGKIISLSDSGSSLSWSPDSQLVAVASIDPASQNNIPVCDITGCATVEGDPYAPSKRTKIYNLQGNIVTTISGFTAPISWSPNGKFIVSGGSHRIQVWNLDTKKDLAELNGNPPMFWSPDGKILTTVSSNDNKSLIFWSTTGQKIATLVTVGGTLTDYAWSSDSKELATAYNDGTVWLWDTTGKSIASASIGANKLSWTSDNKFLNTGTKILNSKGEIVNTTTNTSSSVNTYNLASSSYDAKFMALVESNGNIVLLDSTDKKISDLSTDFSDQDFKGKPQNINSFIWTQDNSKVIACACTNNNTPNFSRYYWIWDTTGKFEGAFTAQDIYPAPNGNSLLATYISTDNRSYQEYIKFWKLK